jgi:hypothetical protein
MRGKYAARTEVRDRAQLAAENQRLVERNADLLAQVATAELAVQAAGRQLHARALVLARDLHDDSVARAMAELAAERTAIHEVLKTKIEAMLRYMATRDKIDMYLMTMAQDVLGTTDANEVFASMMIEVGQWGGSREERRSKPITNASINAQLAQRGVDSWAKG